MPSSRKFPTPAPRRGDNSHQAPTGEHTGGHTIPNNILRSESTPHVRSKDVPAPGNRPERAPGQKKEGFTPPARGKKRYRPEAPLPGGNATRPVTAASGTEAGGTPAGDAEGTLLPGIKPVTELLETDPAKIDAVFIRKGRKGQETDKIIDLCRAAGVRFSLVDDTSLDRIWRGRHQGVIARLFATGFAELSDLLDLAPDAPLPLILALDQVQDPGNAGTLARTLYALGGAGIIVPKHNGVYLGAAASRVAAGALEKLPVAKVSNLAQALDAARDGGYAVYGADAATNTDALETENVHTFTPRLPAVLVLGGEDGGIRPIIRKRCSHMLAIPFAREFDSLNVAQAGAIIIAAFAGSRNATR